MDLQEWKQLSNTEKEEMWDKLSESEKEAIKKARRKSRYNNNKSRRGQSSGSGSQKSSGNSGSSNNRKHHKSRSSSSGRHNVFMVDKMSIFFRALGIVVFLGTILSFFIAKHIWGDRGALSPSFLICIFASINFWGISALIEKANTIINQNQSIEAKASRYSSNRRGGSN